MTTVALVLAALAAALHVFIWTMESITWTQPSTWRRFGVASQAEADTTEPMAYNQGYYNLFLAVGAAAGIVFQLSEQDEIGWTLIVFACGSMVAASLVLVTTGFSYARAAATQGTIPVLAVIASLIAMS